MIDDCDRDPETFEDDEITDEQELINDDNKSRANDMNAVNRSYY